ncbi:DEOXYURIDINE 5' TRIPHOSPHATE NUCLEOTIDOHYDROLASE [Encephalitozoon cuniculi GB-M1]|uniref:Deoxyuridine 5'-triphosphate nucleotidohydrolase n=2 Tax=Encephalitozoon cuniculi TaxID=6035 RepID=DUT_ENCCU|nr:dUTPase [Encephalitozoon cuniculi GB-M1]Q8SRS0.1 RecName: Full=Deoxyuridine 5'-triphosphate nucleotidohydrolase; Short=dUTPase; AltName: Full=dUTP pyrophosphatase [Encephalitozoon cuniculi GB-M1]AGE95765.1 deoxyuridine 5' triphosphate nucleotidohydrolase [Encephalitozoon cuniculi]KMV65939.1 dUTPase [Encephalitozoon cuniculi EcunIII-L]UYI27631.1 dUTPase [Encephalitozoon cuniculi]CAD25403.1 DEOXYURIDINE 5' TRIPHOSPHATE NUCLEOTIDOHYDROLASE [Encephalitozoon cuniculi GB-M1]
MTVSEIRVRKINPRAKIPKRQSEGAAGYDIHSVESGRIPPNGRKSVRTGLAWDVPQSVVGLVFGRSGLALRNWIEVVETCVHPGEDKELVITLVNNGREVFEYEESSRIAQLVFVPVLSCEIDLVESLDLTERGCLGFGSTGMK